MYSTCFSQGGCTWQDIVSFILTSVVGALGVLSVNILYLSISSMKEYFDTQLKSIHSQLKSIHSQLDALKSVPGQLQIILKILSKNSNLTEEEAIQIKTMMERNSNDDPNIDVEIGSSREN